jgi:hypothetical protein
MGHTTLRAKPAAGPRCRRASGANSRCGSPNTSRFFRPRRLRGRHGNRASSAAHVDPHRADCRYRILRTPFPAETSALRLKTSNSPDPKIPHTPRPGTSLCAVATGDEESGEQDGYRSDMQCHGLSPPTETTFERVLSQRLGSEGRMLSGPIGVLWFVVGTMGLPGVRSGLLQCKSRGRCTPGRERRA